MKNLLPVLALLALVSCGGDSSSSNGSSRKTEESLVDFPALFPDSLSHNEKINAIEVLSKNTPQVRIGDSKVSKTTGKQLNFDDPSTLQDLNETRTEIVLKVEGDLIYSYDVHVDQIKNKTTYTIYVLKDMRQEIEKEMLKSHMSLNGDTLSISRDLSNGERSTIINAFVSLSKPCETTFVIGVKEFIYKDEDGKEFPTLAYAQKTIVSCGKTYRKQELMKLDLTNIDVCETKDDDNSLKCTEKDMSHLVE